MSEYETAALLARLDERTQMIQDEQEKMKEDLKKISEQANKWKGAFIVILALGGMVGSLITVLFGKWVG